MKKDNDEIPEDEMLLAEALAACGERKLCYADGFMFGKVQKGLLGPQLLPVKPSQATNVCALGALTIAGKFNVNTARNIEGGTTKKYRHLVNVPQGNDSEDHWGAEGEDAGESLGYAFRSFFDEE